MKITAWGHKISSKLSSMSQYSPDMFVKSQWQRTAGVSVYYLIYRWAMASVFLAVLVASLVEVGRRSENTLHYVKWPIYLTHWGISMCTIQALMAAYLVTRATCSQQDLDGMKMNCMVRTYWILHSCATVGAFAITFIYWFFVYNPDENVLDALNLLIHAGNSILMATDLIVVSHPVRLIDFYWPISFSIGYAVFSFIYFEAGGTDRKGRWYIYKILDWQKPGRTLIILQLCIVLVLVLHLSVCVFSVLRCKSAELCKRRKAQITEARTKHLQGATNEIPIDDILV